jgi:hypothetical protein
MFPTLETHASNYQTESCLVRFFLCHEKTMICKDFCCSSFHGGNAGRSGSSRCHLSCLLLGGGARYPAKQTTPRAEPEIEGREVEACATPTTEAMSLSLSPGCSRRGQFLGVPCFSGRPKGTSRLIRDGYSYVCFPPIADVQPTRRNHSNGTFAQPSSAAPQQPCSRPSGHRIVEPGRLPRAALQCYTSSDHNPGAPPPSPVECCLTRPAFAVQRASPRTR